MQASKHMCSPLPHHPPSSLHHPLPIPALRNAPLPPLRRRCRRRRRLGRGALLPRRAAPQVAAAPRRCLCLQCRQLGVCERAAAAVLLLLRRQVIACDGVGLTMGSRSCCSPTPGLLQLQPHPRPASAAAPPQACFSTCALPLAALHSSHPAARSSQLGCAAQGNQPSAPQPDHPSHPSAPSSSAGAPFSFSASGTAAKGRDGMQACLRCSRASSGSADAARGGGGGGAQNRQWTPRLFDSHPRPAPLLLPVC